VTMSASNRRTGLGLAPVGHQFPLGRPKFEPPPADEVDDSALLPFGIRFFRSAAPVDSGPPTPYRYDPEQQLAVAIDRPHTPLIDLPMAADERTTTGHSDGGKPRGEEFMFDRTDDQL